MTLDVPKPLIPVANRPFLEHVLANLGRHGVTEAILTTGYRAEDFEGFPAEATHGVKLTIVREDEPLGTCGAVKNVESMLDGTFLVLNGDILTDLDLSDLVSYHREKGAAGTLTLTPVSDPSAYGLVPIDDDGHIQRFIEKPTREEIVTDLINAGTYVLEPEALALAPAGQNYSFERGLFPTLLDGGRPLYGKRSHAYWLDLGTPERYLTANRDVLGERVGEPPPGRRTGEGGYVAQGVEVPEGTTLSTGVTVGSAVRIGEGARIDPPSSLGPRCSIGPGAVVRDSILHEGVVVEAEAVIEGSILGRGSHVGADCRIVDAVVGHMARIGAGNELRAGIRVWPGLTIPEGSVRF